MPDCRLDDFGPLLRAMRDAAGLTQAQLAALVGVARPRVTEWETGTRRPEAETMWLLALCCGHDLNFCATPLLHWRGGYETLMGNLAAVGAFGQGSGPSFTEYADADGVVLVTVITQPGREIDDPNAHARCFITQAGRKALGI